MASPIRQDDASGLTIATEEISSAHHQKVIITKTSTGAAVSPLTDTELRASDVNVSLDSEVVHSIVDSGAITATLSAETTKVIGTVNVTHNKTIKTVSGTLTSDTDIIAAVVGKRIKVIAYSVISAGTNLDVIIFKSNGTSGTELWRVALQSLTSTICGANLAIAAPSFLFATVAGEKLTMDVNQTDAIHYSVTYFDDDAS